MSDGSLGAEDDARALIEASEMDLRVFVRLVYTTVLSRTASSDEIDHWCNAIRDGRRTRSAVVEDFLTSPEFREKASVEQAVRTGIDNERWRLGGAPLWPGSSERVVEIAWVLSRCHGVGRLLDVGYANAAPAYLAALAEPSPLRLGRVYGVDLATRSIPGLRTTVGNLCRLPLRDGAFDVVTCISTLEHVGSDNRRYGIAPSLGQGTMAQALAEFARVLAPAGRLLVTVPFGKFEDRGWFVQFDERAWLDLIRASPFVVEESAVFRHGELGWVGASRLEEMADLRYGDGTAGASGVLCAELSTHT
jgi:O-antigen chain-terminating methyltransferase